MAGQQTSLSLQDRMSGPLMKIMKAMDQTISVMERMDASATNIDTRGLSRARSGLQSASAEMERFLSATRTANANGLQPLQNQFTNLPGPIARATGAVKSFFSSFVGAATAYLSIQGLANGFKGFIKEADSYTSTSARLALINDQTQTQAKLQEKVYQAAQRSATGYNEMAGSVAKLNLLAGDAFGSNDEAIRFTELMGKAFSVSGASTQDKSSAMLQLNQAMASGVLQGDEYKSIRESAPMLAQAIADSMGVSMGALKKLSSEGAITADIVKNALFSAGADIEGMFKNMPLTFADAMTKLKNWGLMAFEPLFVRFSQFVNSDAFGVLAGHVMWFVNVFIAGMSMMFTMLETVYNEVGAIGQLLSDSWSVVGPVIIVAAAALGTYLAMMVALKTALLVHAAIEGIRALALAATAAAMTLASGATLMATAAQHGLNAALLAFPGTWILLAFVAVIALIIYALISWAQQTAAVVGVVVGSFAWLGGAIYNILLGIGNFGIMVAEWFVNTWNQAIYYAQLAWIGFNLVVRKILDSIGNGVLATAEWIANTFNTAVFAIQTAFYVMARMILTIMGGVADGVTSTINSALGGISTLINGAISGVNSFIGVLNKVLDTDLSTIGTVDLKMGKGATSFAKDFQSLVEAPTKAANVSFGRMDTAGDYMKDASMPTAPTKQSFDRLEYANLGNVYAKGNDLGQSLSLAASDKLTAGMDKIKGLMKGPSASENPFNPDAFKMDDAMKALGGDDLAKTKNPTGGKLDSVGKIEKDINIADEDIKLMRDLAEIKSIQNIITLTPQVQFGDTHIREEADIPKIVKAIEKSFNEEMARSAEGVYT